VALRASAKETGIRVDLRAVIGGSPESETGVPGSAALRHFAAAVARGSIVELLAPRTHVAEMGAEALVDAAAVAAFFNAFDRVADATGTITDEPARDALSHLLPGVDIATTIGAGQPR
jgi:hypothetical protein